MQSPWSLSCSVCHREAEPGVMGRCAACEGILAPYYGDDVVAQLSGIQPGRGLDRYRALLPVSVPVPNLGEGDTPLLPSRRLGENLGLRNLYFKNEGGNPTGAFKDRGGAMVAALALEAGAKGILTASSGNAAAAISAYAAAAGLPCVILFEPGNPTAKLRQALATGARVLPVEGIFSHGPLAIAELIWDVARRLQYYSAFIWAPVNPYILEGIKSISYELVARLPGPPDVVVCPVGGGDMFAAQWRGYLELQRAGVIDRLPRMVAVQSESAPPLLVAYRGGEEHVPTLPYANSRISGINVPFTGDHALAAIRESGGCAAGVLDEQAYAMQAGIGREEGIWVEPASAAPVAALVGLLERGEIGREETVVCIMSGAGFKDTTLAQAETEAVGSRPPVPFDAEAIAGEALS
jgi:threonine synthase